MILAVKLEKESFYVGEELELNDITCAGKYVVNDIKVDGDVVITTVGQESGKVLEIVYPEYPVCIIRTPEGDGK